MFIQFSDTKVSIKELKLGAVIEQVTYIPDDARKFGHINGFCQNSLGEFIISVLLHGEQRHIHPGNLIFNITE